MFENELQAYEAFGLTPPAQEQPGDGEQPDTPEPAEVDRGPGVQEEQVEPTGDGGQAEPPPEEEPMEDPFAAQREELNRQHEQAMERLRQDHTAQLDAVAASLGLKDPYNGSTPITTHAQLTAYQAAAAAARVAQVKRQANMTDQQFDEMVAGLPEVQAARAAKEAADQAAETARRQQARQKLDADLAEIGKLCPEIRSDLDLVNHKSYPQIQRLLQENGNLGVAAAFRLANFDDLMNRGVEAAAQRARNQAASKDHLKPTQSRGTGGVQISREQEAMYRRFLPDATRAEILRYHEKYTKEGKEQNK